DNADNQAQNAVAINIDTTAPTISGTLAGTLGANNWYISSVQAAVSVSDITSGIASTEYSADGGAWANYTTPISFASGGHQIQFRTTDTAGLLSETEIFDFKIDSSAPEIHLPSRWYIWESGTFTVKDAGSKIISVSYQIRDSQNRWKKVERNWTPDRTSFSHTISWNRLFADGITAPIGTYDVIIYAENEAGNRSQKSAQIIIPQPNATALPTFTPTPTATNTPLTTPTATVYNAPLIVPTATQTPFVFLPPEPRETEENNGFFSFFNLPPSTSSGTGQDTNPNILWGVAAAAALGAFNAVIAEKKRKEAEAREKRAQNNNSNHTKRRAAEKAGTLGAYIREIRKERAAQVKAKVASILHKEEKKKDEKLREKSGLSEKEWKKKQARQARWDANGAIEYEVKKERIIRKETWKEKALNFKEQLLNPPPSPPEPSLAEVQARMAKEKQLEQEQTLADWKEADMVAASRAVIAQEEDETLSQAENNQEEETLLDKIFGWLDTWKSVLQQGQEDTGISVEPVDTGGLSECLIPIGFQDAPPDDIHYAFQEIG
ncbi:MAG: hypothetical protein HN922_05895, partial [Anaerolineae bacterium]|nr:hypothetical protein [Anaerolineae bacterium]